MSVKRLKEDFPEVVSGGDRPIEYSGMEKCKIKTHAGKKVVLKGQVVPQALRQRALRGLREEEPDKSDPEAKRRSFRRTRTIER